MSAALIDGRAIAAAWRARAAEAAAGFERQVGRKAKLAVVLVGEDPASQVYVGAKAKACAEAGMDGAVHRLPANVGAREFLELVTRLGDDKDVDGILVQLPLPAGIAEHAAIAAIAPDKDVDGFHAENVGALWSGKGRFVPCTPLGCLVLLRTTLGTLAGREALVIGRSNIVGKPMAALLLQNDCTVTLAHSRSRDLPALAARADILVAAAGRPGMVKGDWLKSGATVIDVGINRVVGEDGKSRLTGDVDFESACARAGAITPVPGGVGPMTIAMLLRNTLVAAFARAGLDAPAALADTAS